MQATERMKIVDVLGAKQFSDGERIITQVGSQMVKDDIIVMVGVSTMNVRIVVSFPPQGDKADCFYIVETGEVKIMMKSKVRSC